MLNDYLKFTYMLFGAMAIIYCIFNIKDFFKSWASWAWLLVKGIGNLIKKGFVWAIGLFKKG
jgi:hypothetical protein